MIEIGIAFGSYRIDSIELERCGIRVVECLAHEMHFSDRSFDAVVMSHVLEHCPSVGETLNEVRRVLAPNSLLMVFIPPHNHFELAGHVSMDWNIG